MWLIKVFIIIIILFIITALVRHYNGSLLTGDKTIFLHETSHLLRGALLTL